jgi:hypothetical protein
MADRQGREERFPRAAVEKPTDNRRTLAHTWSICVFRYSISDSVGMGRRPRATSHLDAVRAGIGSALRSLYSNVLNEPLPERIAELLKQLDEQLGQRDRADDA